MNKKIISVLVIVVGLTAIAPTVFAETAASTSTAAAKVACVGVAVNARENALDAGLGLYVKASVAAYAARRVALKKAYATTTYMGAHTASQAAWSGFGTAFDTAVANWTTVKSSTWARYNVALLACKTPTSTGDAAFVVSGF